MPAGVRNLVAAGVVIACAAPTTALSVWPRVSRMLADGANSADVGFVVFVTMAGLLMAATPFAMDRTKTRGRKWTYCLFGLALACINFTLAQDSIGGLRHAGAGVLREKMNKAAVLDSRIVRATNSRKLLPQVAPAVDLAMLTAATQDVDLAEAARKQECGKVGDNCRLRVSELKAATEKRAPLLAAKAQADQIAALETELREAEAEKLKLGDIPTEAQPHAARLAKLIGRFVDLGDKPIDTVEDWLITLMAVGTEWLGLLGPNLLMTAIFGGEPAAPTAKRQRWWRRRHIDPDVSAKPEMVDITPPPAPVPAPEIAAPTATPATPAKRKKPSKSKVAGVRECGSVREWKETRTVARSGSKLKPSDMHAAYSTWCHEKGLKPVNITIFGLALKRDLGVRYEERNKRGFYCGIALVSSPILVVSNA